MTFARPRTLSVVLGAALLAGGLAACSTEADAPKPAPIVTEKPTDPTPEKPASEGDQPDWANPTSISGDLITSVTAGDITVDVYQVGVVQATKRGNFVTPDTNKPIIDVGDDIVFVNYVVTNKGAAIDLGASLVSVSARYADWPYLQGMDSITDFALFDSLKVNHSATAPGSYRDPSVYTFGSGETYSVAQNFRHQKDSPIEFTVRVTPVDAAAKLQHDQKVEAKATGTIK